MYSLIGLKKKRKWKDIILGGNRHGKRYDAGTEEM